MQNNSVAITIEKDHIANPHSRNQRHSIQRSLGFKNIVIYTLLFVNLLLCSKLYSIWSRNNNIYNGSFATSTLTEPDGGHEGTDTSSPEFWLKMALIFALVMIGGLTIGLMGLDETNLHVLMASGSPTEQAHAETVYKLLSRGKHWVLVTLLLGNVIVNETLPVVLDSELGGGIIAILISTLLIVVFGEIIPQAVCARYGLAIGAYCAKPMLLLMYIMSPVAYPIACLLDSWLGVHHGTTYRRTELKTLVSLHQVDGIGELTDDEVTIIASVLDLKEKPVSAVMTPLDDVFTLSEDAILDEQLMDEIVSAGYSRIPIYRHDDHNNFIGMLLVKRLITYDPEDHTPVRQFTINSLPEAAPNTSCLDILNFFQEGRSHMAIVTSEPGGFGLPIGIITLEDVIEELLGEEIVDESDVYVDVHNKIKVIRKPSRNISMIKNLKSLLKSPAISESTPLLGNASAHGHKVTVPVDSKYLTTGKTIIQPQKSTSTLISNNTAANTAANAQHPTAEPTKKTDPESIHPFQAGALLKGDINKDDQAKKDDANKSDQAKKDDADKDDQTKKDDANRDDQTKKDEHHNKVDHHHKHEHVDFKDNVEVIIPAESTTPSNEAEERTIIIEMPEATGTYPINPPSEAVAAVIEYIKASEQEDVTAASPVTETPVKPTVVSPVTETPVEPTVASPVTETPVEPTVASPVIETPVEPTTDNAAESSMAPRQMTESESNQTLPGTGENPNSPGNSSPKKKNKKKKSKK
ncbi:hypothetical protein BGX27_006777 [Mortierella sp. AM989]|nr:hypothetical protein BGX27_006777 [Mortierella sp. AM989]